MKNDKAKRTWIGWVHESFGNGVIGSRIFETKMEADEFKEDCRVIKVKVEAMKMKPKIRADKAMELPEMIVAEVDGRLRLLKIWRPFDEIAFDAILKAEWPTEEDRC